MIERKEYLKQLLSWKDQSIIKVLTGIRRCGKSTILKLICGLIGKDSGEITTSGGDIAMVFQYSALFDSLNVFNNIAFAYSQ